MGSLALCEAIYDGASSTSNSGNSTKDNNNNNNKDGNKNSGSNGLPFAEAFSKAYSSVYNAPPPFLPGFYVLKLQLNETLPTQVVSAKRREEGCLERIPMNITVRGVRLSKGPNGLAQSRERNKYIKGLGLTCCRSGRRNLLSWTQINQSNFLTDLFLLAHPSATHHLHGFVPALDVQHQGRESHERLCAPGAAQSGTACDRHTRAHRYRV